MIESSFTKQNIDNFELSNIINGPVSLSILQSSNNKCFAFGDFHLCANKEFNNNGDYIPLFLDKLFNKYETSNFDLMLETRYYRTKYFDPNETFCNIMNNVYIQFDDYFMNKKELPNVHFHNLDIRHLHSDLEYEPVNKDSEFLLLLSTLNVFKYIYSNDLIQKINNITSQEEAKLFLVNIKSSISLLFDLNNLSSHSFGHHILQTIYRYEKFKKYYKEIKHINSINSFIMGNINTSHKYYDIFDTYDKLINKEKNILSIEILSLCKKIYKFISDVDAAIFDFYMLIRFTKVLERQGNIILIAGENHINSLECFITYNLGFEYVENYGKYIVKPNEYELLRDMLSVNYSDKIYGKLFNKNIRMNDEIVLYLLKLFVKHYPTLEPFLNIYQISCDYNWERLIANFNDGHINANIILKKDISTYLH